MIETERHRFSTPTPFRHLRTAIRVCCRSSRFRARYQRWLEANLPFFDLLVVGLDTARRFAELRRELKVAGTPIPSNDAWIASLAHEHRLPVATRDVHCPRIACAYLVTPSCPPAPD